MISGAGTARGATITGAADGFFSRIRRSPCEYSNSSRLCSLMNFSNCSICWSSEFANIVWAAGFGDSLRFMPVLYLNKIPRNAGQHFGSIFVHGNIVFDPDSSHARHIHAGLNGHDVARLQNLLLSLRHPGILMHFQPEPVTGAVYEVSVQILARKNAPGGRVHFPAGRSGTYRRN